MIFRIISSKIRGDKKFRNSIISERGVLESSGIFKEFPTT
jgi:hypothetical protein